MDYDWRFELYDRDGEPLGRGGTGPPRALGEHRRQREGRPCLRHVFALSPGGLGELRINAALPVLRCAHGWGEELTSILTSFNRRKAAFFSGFRSGRQESIVYNTNFLKRKNKQIAPKSLKNKLFGAIFAWHAVRDSNPRPSGP